MLLKKIVFMLCALIALQMQAQELKFGKVSPEELKETVYAQDSSAAAAYLYKERNSYYQNQAGSGLMLITEIRERIKIYDKNGLDYATKTIQLYQSGSTDEKISGLKGYTFNEVDGKVAQIKLGKDGIFKSEYSKNIKEVKLTMPQVKVGSVIEYKYKITSPFVWSIDEFVMQSRIPIRKLEASMGILEYFEYNQREKGFYMLNPKISKFNDSNIGAKVNKIEYSLTNMPKLKSERYVSNINNYRSGVRFEIVSLEIPQSGVYEVFSKTWDDVVETIYESDSFGAEMKKKNYFEDELDALLSSTSDKTQRMQIVLDFVKEKVKWNSSRGVSCAEGVKKAFKNKSGNSGDMNLMLVAMLEHAGIKAYPVITSTRDNGIPLFPTLQGFNYVVAAAKINENYILLDATDPYSMPDVLPVRTLNWFGRMISENGNSTSIDLMPKHKAEELTMMNVVINTDGSIDGKLRQRYTNHYAMNFRSKYNETTEDSFLETMEKENSDIEISNYVLKDNEDVSKPITQSYELFKEDMIDVIGDKLYFNPLFHMASSENPFKIDKREYPVDFGYPWQDKYMITIKIPEGYKVESLPQSTLVSLPENMGTFRYQIQENAGAITVNALIAINTAVIASTHYDFLKEFYSQMVEKETEKVVLSKI